MIEASRRFEEIKPFFVHGAIADGRIQATFISIVQRRNDETVSIQPVAIHSRLAVVRVCLRRRELPEKD